MPDLAQGNFANVILSPGDSVRVSTSGQATVSAEYGAPAGTTTINANSQLFGPYGVPAKLRVTAVSGAANYASPTLVPATVDPSTGQLSPPVSGAVKILAMSAVPIAHTGTTAATILAEVPIPAGVMGPNGALRVTAYWSMTNNANSKNLVISWGGINAQIWSAGLTSVAAAACQVMVSNRGATGSQVFTSTGTGASLGTLPGFGTASEDTTIQQRIRFTGNLANASDTLTLERYVVELLS